MAEDKKAVITINDVDYTEDQLTDEQKLMINHINSLQQKIGSAQFNLDQLQVGKKAFVDMLTASLAVATVSTDTDTNRANNTFNWQLQEYRKASSRLARYRLADGRPEVWEDQPAGEYDEEGNEFVESVLVQSAVEPLVATVEQTTYDMDGVATVATVANPLIVADDEERAAAQAVVDGTPVGVVDF